MRNVHIMFFLAVMVFASACKKDADDTAAPSTELDAQLESALSSASEGNGLDFFKFPDSDDYSNIPQDPLNPITAEKVKLGAMLYHETALGINPEQGIGLKTYSCASCHFASAGFQAGRWQGISEGGVGFGHNGEGRERGTFYDPSELDVQPIRTPTAMNTAYQEAMLWNGQFGATGINAGTEYAWTEGTPIEKNNLGFQGTEIQAIAGLGVHRMGVDDNLLDTLGYRAFFDDAFSDKDVDDRYSSVTAGLAIAAYERTLLANQAPFQKWLKGDKTAMGTSEKRGAVLFFTKAQCSNCHTGPALNKMEFHALGMSDLYECPETVFGADENSGANLGRAQFTGLDDDKFKFKIPQLYNLKDSPFFGHGATFRSVKAVVAYKNDAITEKSIPASQVAADFRPLQLTSTDIDDITAFLEESLHDPNLARYQVEGLSGNCVPNSDPLSVNHLGCN